MNPGTIIDTVLRRNEGNKLTSELILGISVTLSEVLARQAPPAPTPVAATPTAPAPNSPAATRTKVAAKGAAS